MATKEHDYDYELGLTVVALVLIMVMLATAMHAISGLEQRVHKLEEQVVTR